jgi:serine/threonine protein phosphatase PrpC
MADFVVRFGGCSAQGKRPNNEDRYVTDGERHVFLVADGMGGQEQGEEASRLAADIIPKAVSTRLAAREEASAAVQHAMEEAHQAIMAAGQKTCSTRRMGTTAVLALHQDNQVYVSGIGDSPAFLVRGGQIDQLTIDHTIADALARKGSITPEQAKASPWRNVLYRFLGCAEMTEGAEVRPFQPQAGDRLVLASDGLSGLVTHDDLRQGAKQCPDPQEWAEQLVRLALERGSTDNVTCVVIAFDAE